jgi:hypothetical protein
MAVDDTLLAQLPVPSALAVSDDEANDDGRDDGSDEESSEGRSTGHKRRRRSHHQAGRYADSSSDESGSEGDSGDSTSDSDSEQQGNSMRRGRPAKNVPGRLKATARVGVAAFKGRAKGSVAAAGAGVWDPSTAPTLLVRSSYFN